MTGMLTPLLWITTGLTATIAYRHIHPPGKPSIRHEIAVAVIAYTITIIVAVFAYTFVTVDHDPITNVPTMPSTPWGPYHPTFEWLMDTIT